MFRKILSSDVLPKNQELNERLNRLEGEATLLVCLFGCGLAFLGRGAALYSWLMVGGGRLLPLLP